MKRNIILVAFLFVLSFSLAQSVNSNYVQTKTMLSANGQKSIDKIVYYDGLGRPVETTLKGITPEKADLVTLTDYSANVSARNGFPCQCKAMVNTLLLPLCRRHHTEKFIKEITILMKSIIMRILRTIVLG